MNVLLSNPEFKVTDNGRGIIREYLYENGAKFREYRSHATFMGLPLVVIANGRNPETGEMQTAEGFISVGQFARGVIAIGQVARGTVAIGQLALGSFVSIGQFAIAPISLGQFAFAIVAAGQIGAAVAGVFQIGWVDMGWILSDLF